MNDSYQIAHAADDFPLASLIEVLLRHNDQKEMSILLENLKGFIGAKSETVKRAQFVASYFGCTPSDLETLVDPMNQHWTVLLSSWVQASLYAAQGQKEEAKREFEAVYTNSRALPNALLKFVSEYHFRQSELVYYTSHSDYSEIGRILRAIEALLFEVEKAAIPGPNSLLLQLLLLHLIIFTRLQLYLVVPSNAFQARDSILIALGKAIGTNKLISLAHLQQARALGHQAAHTDFSGTTISVGELSNALTRIPERERGDLHPIEFLELLRMMRSMEDIAINQTTSLDGKYSPHGWDLRAIIQVEISLIQLIAFWFSIGPSSLLLIELEPHIQHLKHACHTITTDIPTINELPTLLALLSSKAGFRAEDFTGSLQRCEGTLQNTVPQQDSSAAHALLFLQGQCLYATRQFENAKHVFERLVKANYRAAQAYNYLGIIEHHCKRPWASLSLFKKAVAADVFFFPPLYNISRLYHSEKRWDHESKALNLVLPHLEADMERRKLTKDMFQSFASDAAPPSPISSSNGVSNLHQLLDSQTCHLSPYLIRLRKAQNYRNSGLFDSAVDELHQLESLLEKKKYGPEEFVTPLLLRHELARTFLVSQQYSLVPDLLVIVADFASPDVVGLSLLAESSLRSGKPKDAITSLKLALEISAAARAQLTPVPEDFTSHSELESNLKRAKLQATRTSFTYKGRNVFVSPETQVLFHVRRRGLFELDMYNNLAAAHQSCQEYEKAMEAFSKALVIANNLFSSTSTSDQHTSPRLTAAYYNYCLLAFKLGKHRIAGEWIAHRFKTTNWDASILQRFLALTETQLQSVPPPSGLMADASIIEGEVSQWSLLQLDKATLILAISQPLLSAQ